LNNSISIKDLNKADLLAALFNRAQLQGKGIIHYDPNLMTREIAVKLLKQATCFDYIQGRVLKVDLSTSEFDPYLYDRGNGQGAATEVVEMLRKGSK